jgi:ribose-phosphate pyrophosphokinase
MALDDIALFDLDPEWGHGRRIADDLEIPVSPHEERGFEDGEFKVRPLMGVRNKDVYVVQSLQGDARRSVHDKLCRLLFFIGAVKDASAGRVTAVTPYLAYARKDRRTKPRDPPRQVRLGDLHLLGPFRIGAGASKKCHLRGKRYAAFL